MREYAEIPILAAARRCGVRIDERTAGRVEVRAACPFCGDKPRGNHFYMNTEKNRYICFLCGASGNSVSLCARLHSPSLSYGEAARALLSENSDCVFSEPRKASAPAAKPPDLRHAVYTAMLGRLGLEKRHLENLRGRGFSDERIERNMYRSLPVSEGARRALARMLSDFYDLSGIPGFYADKHGARSVTGSPGLLVPVRDMHGRIAGLQIRLDGAGPKRRYRWLSSGGMDSGAGSGSPVHVTGDIARSRGVAHVTEGALKGDAASFLAGDALFVCVAGVNAVRGLCETVSALGAKEAVLAFDMDRLTNPHVAKATEDMRLLLSRAGNPKLKVTVKSRDASYKGIDNYYLGLRNAAA
jgi:hypothetical protein